MGARRKTTVSQEIGNDDTFSESYITTIYAKSTNQLIRIRKGPGSDYEHTGKYVDNEKQIEIVEEMNGWGLLSSYKEDRDGWVDLQWFKKIR